MLEGLPVSFDSAKTNVLGPVTLTAKLELLSRVQCCRNAVFTPVEAWMLKPPTLLRIVVSSTTARALAVPARLMPFCVKFRMEHLRMVVFPPPTMVTPFRPVPNPSISSPSRRTLSVSKTDMTIPLVPDTSTPASKPTEVMLMDFVMVTAPKPPGSRTLISPPGAVLEMAPAKVLQGAVRLQGLASSPTPDTQVRVA